MLSEFPLAAVLPASNVDRAKHFYIDTLGFHPTQQFETGEMLLESGGASFLVYGSEYAGTNKATAASWTVSNLDEVVDELKQHGVQFEHYEMPGIDSHGDIATSPDGLRAAWFKDTEGNILGITEMPATAR